MICSTNVLPTENTMNKIVCVALPTFCSCANKKKTSVDGTLCFVYNYVLFTFTVCLYILFFLFDIKENIN